MEIDKEPLCDSDVPQLRVFSGEEADEASDRDLPDPIRQARREWVRREAYWAGRNRARRLSARLVA